MKFININLVAIAYLQAARAKNVIDGAAAGGTAEVVRQLVNETETTAATTPEVDPVTADGFTAVDGDFSMVSSLTIDPPCPKDETVTYPVATYTIQPSTVPFVSAYPADLVNAVVRGNGLQFEYNDAVANTTDIGGIRIGLPPDQFKSLSVGGGISTQVLNGFTSVEELDVSGAAKLNAELSSSSIIASATSRGASTVTIQADTVTTFLAEGASKLFVDGSVGGGSVSGVSMLVVTGDIQGSVSNSGVSTIKANTISGSVASSGVSKVNAVSCDNASGDLLSPCTVSSPPDVEDSLFDAISSSSTMFWCEWSSTSETTWTPTSTNGAPLDIQSSGIFSIAAVVSTAAMVVTLLV